jgi:hypothetical protein
MSEKNKTRRQFSSLRHSTITGSFSKIFNLSKLLTKVDPKLRTTLSGAQFCISIGCQKVHIDHYLGKKFAAQSRAFMPISSFSTFLFQYLDVNMDQTSCLNIILQEKCPAIW